MTADPEIRRKPADPREGMTCPGCGAVLTRQEWPQHKDDPGYCDRCLNGDVA